MNNSPKRLNIKLGKRNLFPLKMFLLCLAAGWLSNRSYAVGPAMVSSIVGGGVLWLFLASPSMHKLYRHEMWPVRYLSIVAGLMLTVASQAEVIPWLMEKASVVG